MDVGAYYHDKFIRGEKDLTFTMFREAAYACRKVDAHNPDFYAHDCNGASSCQQPLRQEATSQCNEDVFQGTSLWHACHLPQSNRTPTNGDQRSTLDWMNELYAIQPQPIRSSTRNGQTAPPMSLSEEERMMLALLEPSPILSLTDESFPSEGDLGFFEGRRFFFLDPSREFQ